MSANIVPRPKVVIVNTTLTNLLGNASGTLPNFDLSPYKAIDLILTANFTAGTSPACNFSFNTVDAAGNAPQVQNVTQTGSGTQTQGVGLAAQANKVLGMTGQIGYNISGAPTSTNLTFYIVGYPN